MAKRLTTIAVDADVAAALRRFRDVNNFRSTSDALRYLLQLVEERRKPPFLEPSQSCAELAEKFAVYLRHRESIVMQHITAAYYAIESSNTEKARETLKNLAVYLDI
jgi:Arc/MetJ-type ribon-helix-helix transcriptional regulator